MGTVSHCITLIIALNAMVGCSYGDVIVIDRKFNKSIDIMADDPSEFGSELPDDGFRGLLNIAHPIHACGPVDPPPPLPEDISDRYSHWVALIHRHNCTYSEKVLNAQAAGYAAVIVMNIGSDMIKPMSARGGEADNVTIPSVFIGQTDGDTLKMFFKNYNRFGVILTDDLPFDIQSYLLPFAVTVAVCFLGMLICMIIKCVRDYRRSMRHRLSWRALRRLPLHKFQPGVDTYEVCAICLEDYVEADKLRILPCNHAYHSRCIDPWLTKRRRVCPVCKQKVRVGSDSVDSDDDDSDTERSTSERAPLLQQATQVSAGTFTNSRENPFQRARREREERYQRHSEDGDDDIHTASDVSSSSPPADGSEDTVSRPLNDESAVSGAKETSVPISNSMLPEEGDQGTDQLDVVTVTRSVRRKKKKTKRRASPGDSSEAASSVGAEGRASLGEVLVDIGGHDNGSYSGDAQESDHHSVTDPIV